MNDGERPLEAVELASESRCKAPAAVTVRRARPREEWVAEIRSIVGEAVVDRNRRERLRDVALGAAAGAAVTIAILFVVPF